MKLYATITSERATKGQGGKYLSIVISDSSNRPVFYLHATKEEGETVLKVDEYDGKSGFGTSGYRTTFRTTKGKKQKGKECGNCGRPATQSIGDRKSTRL